MSLFFESLLRPRSDHMIFVNIVDWLGNGSPGAKVRRWGASVTGRPRISGAIDPPGGPACLPFSRLVLCGANEPNERPLLLW